MLPRSVLLPWGALVSKLAEIEARVLLPLGEGGPKGRMRVHFLPSPGASRHPLPKGEGHARNRNPHQSCFWSEPHLVIWTRVWCSPSLLLRPEIGLSLAP